MSIADSSDEKKISLHVLTSGIRLPNIAQVAMFTELVRKKLSEGLQGKDQEKPPGSRKPSIKLAPSETALSREKNLLASVKLKQSRISNPKDHFVWWDLIHMCTSKGKVSIECKGLEIKRLKVFAGYMVTSNQDAPIKIDIGDSRVVCFEVSACCRSNIQYFDWLGEILDHPDASAKLNSTSLYQHYLEWCGENGEKPLTNNILGQKFAQIGIDKTADIPIFNVPKIIPPKIILTLPEKNTPPLNTSKDKKVDKKSDVTQDLFDYVTEQTEAPVTSTDLEGTTSGTSETSKTPESPINKPKIKQVLKHDSPKPNEVSSAILLARQQREERLRKKAVELDENPDAFVIITKKDRFDSITFCDRMETDSQMCAWTIELEDDPKEHMDMTIRERLIGKEIIRCSLEEDGIISSWLDTDEKWKKTAKQVASKRSPHQFQQKVEDEKEAISDDLGQIAQKIANRVTKNKIDISSFSPIFQELIRIQCNQAMKGIRYHPM
ncbi:hypothetical protein RhiirA5_385815 [Rhizophagus irregularis]|uniref:DNA primase/nucleoside triphosphatase C-terminal domain-containing protein n=1 Tax=Rhizophagus irregularis TaxID=588596 RepID=A0A2N0NMG0_9GLOM|nr:hypothetical protein RhiirA5_385815 [Rhizophagus irregularis]